MSESIDVNYNATPDSINIIFNAGEPNLESVGIDETYVLSTATWNGNLADSRFESA